MNKKIYKCDYYYFFKTFFSYNLSNTLINLKIEFNENIGFQFASNEFENINTFKLLKNLELNHFGLKRHLFLI